MAEQQHSFPRTNCSCYVGYQQVYKTKTFSTTYFSIILHIISHHNFTHCQNPMSSYQLQFKSQRFIPTQIYRFSRRLLISSNSFQSNLSNQVGSSPAARSQLRDSSLPSSAKFSTFAHHNNCKIKQNPIILTLSLKTHRSPVYLISQNVRDSNNTRTRAQKISTKTKINQSNHKQ